MILHSGLAPNSALSLQYLTRAGALQLLLPPAWAVMATSTSTQVIRTDIREKQPLQLLENEVRLFFAMRDVALTPGATITISGLSGTASPSSDKFAVTESTELGDDSRPWCCPSLSLSPYDSPDAYASLLCMRRDT